MSTPYIPPPPQLNPLHSPVKALHQSGSVAPITDVSNAKTEQNDTSDEDTDMDSDDCYDYVDVPPTLMTNRPPCNKCGCTERLSGYGIQFNREARYDGAESHISVCRNCNYLLSYQL
jgi:hypothetical protein